MSYRRQCRLDRAVSLIRDTNLGLEDIANQVGFATHPLIKFDAPWNGVYDHELSARNELKNST